MEEQVKPQNTTPKKKARPKVRTLKDDLAHAVRSGGMTTAKIAIKEQQRRNKLHIESEEAKKPTKIFMILGSFGFLVVALGIFIVLKVDPALSFLNPKSEVIEQKTEISLFKNVTNIRIRPDAGKFVVVEDFNRLFSKGVEDKLQIFDFYTESGDIPVPAETEEFFDYIQINPDSLNYSIEKISYGLDGTSEFILLEMNDFENTFSGMYEWEDKMIRNLETVLQHIRPITTEEVVPNPDYIEPEEVIEEEETEEDVEELEITDTDEEELVPETITITKTIDWRSVKFTDEMFYNKDARLIRNEVGEIGIIYTFIDNKYLLISTEISTIKTMIELISEYYKANY